MTLLMDLEPKDYLFFRYSSDVTSINDLGEMNPESLKFQGINYELYAVIKHSGNYKFGHYAADIKCGHKWYRASDAYISDISMDEAKRGRALIICYKKTN